MDKLTASAGVLSFVSSVFIAAVGGYFTYSYNQRQVELNRTQAEHDSTAKEQANKVLELEAVQKLIPVLTSKDEQSKAAALISLQDLAHPELAAHFAVLFKGPGSVQYLQQAASSENPNAKKTAVQALSTIAANGTTEESQLASRALSSVFESTRDSVVQVVVNDSDQITTGSGIVLTTDGYILTNAHLLRPGTVPAVYIVTSAGTKLAATRITNNYDVDLAIFKVEGAGLVRAHLAPGEVKIGSDVIGIGYANGAPDEMAFVGSVAAVDPNKLYFTSNILPGTSGGPVLDNTGAVVGLISGRTELGPGGHNANLAIAVRSDRAIEYLKFWKIPLNQ